MKDKIMTMTHKGMVAQLKKPGADILATLTAEKVDAWHMVSALVGEVAEIDQAVQKKDRENVVEECGDIEFYLEGLCQTYNITDEDILYMPLPQFKAHELVFLAGELFDSIKKHIIYNKEFDRPALIEAIRNFRSALADNATNFGVTYEEATTHNVNKLGARYKDHKYSDQQAQDRADKAAS